MSQQEEEKFWKKYIKIYDYLNDLYPYKDLINNIVNELDIHKGEKILDAGGGTGNIALHILKCGADVILLDNSKEAINYFINKNRNCKAIKHDLRDKLPFRNESFDKIVCNNTLYILEIKFYNKIIQEFYRILKKNGKLILSNPIKGASPHKILFGHFKIVIKKKGVLFLLKDIFIKIKYLLLILYYNLKIKNKSKYHFFTPQEQEVLLNNSNFNVKKSIRAYLDQNILTIAIKR